MKRAINILAILLSVSLTGAAREFYSIDGCKLKADSILVDTVAGLGTWSYHNRLSLAAKTDNVELVTVLSDIEGHVVSSVRISRPDAAFDSEFGAKYDVAVTVGDKTERYTIDGNRKAAQDELSLVIKTGNKGDNLHCTIGRTEPLVKFELPCDPSAIISFKANCDVKLKRLSCVPDFKGNAGIGHVSRINQAQIDSLASEGSGEISGLWSYLDRDCDPRILNLGGDYRLAVVGEEDGSYGIYYVSGARVAADKWQQGELKGRLRPTRFVNHYNLVWIDALGRVVSDEASADFIEGAILRLNFPLYNSSLRFFKEVRRVR